MPYIDIISGFLGSGKTTFLRQLAGRVYAGQRIAVIENDFGDVSIDAERLGAEGLLVSELTAGCVCCSLTARLQGMMGEILRTFSPYRILLEPSGVARLSDVLRAVDSVCRDTPLRKGMVCTLAAPLPRREYARQFLSVYKNQLQSASLILPTRMELLAAEQRESFLDFLRETAPGTFLLERDWRSLSDTELAQLVQQPPAPVQTQARSFIRVPASEADSFTSVFAGTCAPARLKAALKELGGAPERYGCVLRVKGALQSVDGPLQVDYTPGGCFLQLCAKADNRLVFIGSGMQRAAIRRALQSTFE